MQFATLPIVGALALALAGCANGVSERVASYPNINEIAQASKVRLLTPAEQVAVAAALKAKAARARIQAERRAGRDDARKMADMERRAATHGADALAEIKARCREMEDSLGLTDCSP